MRYNEFLKEICPPLDLEWRKYRRRGVWHRVAARRREVPQALRPDGALMIARKEELGAASPLFLPWLQAPGVFRKVEAS